MNRRAISAVIRKDLKVVLGSKGILMPLIIVPVVIFVALPIASQIVGVLHTGGASERISW